MLCRVCRGVSDVVLWRARQDDEKEFIRGFLTGDLTRRLGNLKGGVDEIKQHRYFKGLDFEKLQSLELKSPYIPRVTGDGDANNFDKYEEEAITYVAGA